MKLPELSISKSIRIGMSKVDFVESIESFKNHGITSRDNIFIINGRDFFNIKCSFKETEILLEAKPKTSYLLIFSIFILIWTIGFTYEHGFIVGLPVAFLVSSFFYFVLRGLMEARLNTLMKIILKK
jgi:hypothetical protein